MNSRRGVTLIETLLYFVLVVGIGGLFIGVLNTSTKVQVHETAGAKVSNQLTFTMTTIDRLVRGSSSIEEMCPNANSNLCLGGTGDNPKTTTVPELSYLKLRMSADSEDPTCIALIDEGSGRGSIRITQGPAAGLGEDDPAKANCKESVPADAITTTDVSVPLSQAATLFNVISNPPSHDIVEVSLRIDSLGSTPESIVSRSLQSAIGRVNAAVFDSNLLPAISGGSSLGALTKPWQNLFLGGGFSVENGEVSQPNNFNGGDRGFFMVGAGAGGSCQTICEAHTGSNACVAGVQFQDVEPDGYSNITAPDNYWCSAPFMPFGVGSSNSFGGLCFCQ